MKVLLVGNYVPDGHTSMLAFRRVLERELPRLGCDLRVIAPPKRVLRGHYTSRWWKWLGYIDKYVLFLPSLASHARWADVVHICDHANAMYVPRVKARPNVITCHDMIAVKAAKGLVDGWKVSWTGRLFQRLIGDGLSRADLVACVSELTRREVLELGLADERHITTVLNGLNDDFSPVAPDEAQRLIAGFGLSVQDKYLIHVGWDLLRKNRRVVLESFIALQQRGAEVVQQLVFVGPELTPEMAELAQAHGVADRIKTVQKISHEELRALYASATALLFPSLQEGFGWPVIEAQACGCPVFTSDLAPMNEIGGDGAVYVDPNDPAAIAAAIEQAAPRLAEMRRLGLANAAHYSSAQMASNYLAAYRRVIDARAGGPMKRLLALGVVVLPWALKRWALRRFWGYQIADDARIGLSYIFPGQLVMGEGARIGHFNVAIHLGRLECGAHSIIERSNWITGHPLQGAHFTHRTGRDPTLALGAHAAITKQHIIDCTDRVDIGAYTTIAGYHSQLITHGIDVVEGRQDCKPIRIGAYCLVGTRVTVLGGAALPDRSVLGAGSVLNKAHAEECAVYAGQPALRVKTIDPEAAYFHRERGFVH